MDNNKSEKPLERFLAGKGFYIVLILCAAVIGVSAWSIIASGAQPESDPVDMSLEGDGVIAGDFDDEPDDLVEPIEPDIVSEAPAVIEDPPESAQTGTFAEGDVWPASAQSFLNPLEGELQRAYSMEELKYDPTMADWRTHDGIDIAADNGTAVRAVHAGTVVSVDTSELYGVCMTVDRGDGLRTTYANLLDTPVFGVGEQVSAGDVIAYVGSTALCETAQEPHLHLSMSLGGQSVDPAGYLPG